MSVGKPGSDRPSNSAVSPKYLTLYPYALHMSGKTPAYSFVSYHNKLLLGHSFNMALRLFTFVFWEINLVHTDPSMSDIKHS